MSQDEPEHVTLWHFTSRQRTLAIWEAGFIAPTDHLVRVKKRMTPDDLNALEAEIQGKYGAPIRHRPGEREAMLREESWDPAPGVPPVVWLTDDPEHVHPHQGWALDAGAGGLDKTEVRIEVSVPQAEVSHWPAWSRQHGIDPEWYETLAMSGDPEHWYVVSRPIPADEIKYAVRTRTGKPLRLRRRYHRGGT